MGKKLVLIVATLVLRNTNVVMLAPMVESALAEIWSLESGGQFLLVYFAGM
jgi:hypothetical protein